MTIALPDNKLRLIEELGVLYEKGGMQPAVARIVALLLISDQTELAFEDIYEMLNISKSAASNALNFLLNTGKIEYLTLPGKRRRYFRFKMTSLKEEVQKSWAGIETMNGLLKKVLEQRPESTAEFNAKLEETTQFLDFLKVELPVLFQKWENRHK